MDCNLKFEKVQDSRDLIPILSQRMETSTHIYNMVQMHPNVEFMEFYTLGKISPSSWILGKCKREDNDKYNFVISPPPEINQEPSNDIIDAFASIPAEIIDWNCMYKFIALEKFTMKMIAEISIQNSNPTEITPLNYYTIKKETKIRCPSPPHGIELKSLNSETGIHHLTNDWPCKTEELKQYLRKCAEIFRSIGVYIPLRNGKSRAVCGAIVLPTGDIAVVAAEAYQGQGYGYLSLCKLAEVLTLETLLVPCTRVLTSNTASNRLQEKIGFTTNRLCFDVMHNKMSY